MTYYSRSEIIKKIIAYARYSSMHQNSVSIDIQLKGIREYCEKNGYEIVRVFIDEAKSGRSTDNRLQYQAMEKFIQENKNEFDALVVYRYDRASRRVNDIVYLEELLEMHRKRFLSCMGDIPETVMGQFFKHSQYAASELEGGQIGERAYDGQKMNAWKGLHTGGIPPLGYILDEDLKLIIDPKEAEAVRIIFTMYDQGAGYGKIASYLNENAYLTKRKLSFKKNSIHDILINQKYMGMYVYNKRWPKVKCVQDNSSKPKYKGNSHKYKDEEDIIRRLDSHEAIIDKELFYRVKEKLEMRSRKPREGKHHYLLRGFIQCNTCKMMMHGDVNHDSKDKTIIRSYYRCPNKKVKVCETKPINRYKLEDLVLGILDQAIFKAPDVKELTKAVNRMIQEDPEGLNHSERYLDALQQKKNQSLRLHRSLRFSESDKTTERIMQELALLEQEQKEIEVKIDELEAMRQVSYSESEIRG